MKYTIIILLTALTIAFISCTAVKLDHPTIKQGVFGRVLWKQGNAMPSPVTSRSTEGSPIKRTVRIYEVAKMTDAEGQSPLFKSIRAHIVASVKTNAKGYFQCELPPGTYSIFTVEENDQLFASLSDGNGQIAPFEVKANKVTTYPILVNYKAFY